MDKHYCPTCDGTGKVDELPLAPALRRDYSMDYRDIACRLLDKLEREGWRPDEVAAMTARIAELDEAPLISGRVDGGLPGAPPAEAVSDRIDELVNRFLSWPLPDSVCSDGVATMRGHPHRIGTNLLTADEARAMLEHVLGSQGNSGRTEP